MNKKPNDPNYCQLKGTHMWQECPSPDFRNKPYTEYFSSNGATVEQMNCIQLKYDRDKGQAQFYFFIYCYLLFFKKAMCIYLMQKLSFQIFAASCLFLAYLVYSLFLFFWLCYMAHGIFLSSLIRLEPWLFSRRTES